MNKYWNNLITGLKAIGAPRLITMGAFFPMWFLTYFKAQNWAGFGVMVGSCLISQYVALGVLREMFRREKK